MRLSWWGRWFACPVPVLATVLLRAAAPGGARIVVRWWFGPADGPRSEAAMVDVNGQRAGAVWCPPYEVKATGRLTPRDNTLRVVANSARKIPAKGPLPDYQALSARYGERLQEEDLDIAAAQPSGLLGPVRLIAR